MWINPLDAKERGIANGDRIAFSTIAVKCISKPK
jgi:anaerobic selenocysteine-containing dehydrogenase